MSPEHFLHHSDHLPAPRPSPANADPLTAMGVTHTDTIISEVAARNTTAVGLESKEAIRQCKKAEKAARNSEKKKAKAEKAEVKAQLKAEKWRRRATRGYDPRAGLISYSQDDDTRLPQLRPHQDYGLSEENNGTPENSVQNGNFVFGGRDRSRRPRGTTWGLNYGGPGKERKFSVGSSRKPSHLSSTPGGSVARPG